MRALQEQQSTIAQRLASLTQSKESMRQGAYECLHSIDINSLPPALVEIVQAPVPAPVPDPAPAPDTTSSSSSSSSSSLPATDPNAVTDPAAADASAALSI